MLLVILSGILVLVGFIIKYNHTVIFKKEQLNNFIAGILFLFALDLSISALLSFFGFKTFYLFTLILVFPLTYYGIIRHSQIKNGMLDKENILALILLSITFLGFLTGLAWAWKEPVVTLNPEKIKISGVYGAEIPLQKVKNISIRNSIPDILNKISGLEFGNILKGNYQMDQLGKARLFLYLNRHEYIYISTDVNYYIINCKDDEKTKELYQSMLLFYPK